MDTRFRRLIAGSAALAVTATLTVGAWPSHASQESPGDPELGTLIAGEPSYVAGTHVWTDYAYDDRGPNTDGLAGGDATYAEEPGNTADLIQLQLGTDGSGSLTVAAVLQTLVPGSEAVVGVGLDTDGQPATGAPTVPGGQWGNGDPIGLERMIVLGTAGGGKLLTWEDGAWVEAGAVDVTVDRTRNVLSATVTELEPGTATWNAVGVVGVEDGEGSSWLDGGQPIYDLSYVRAEGPTKEVVVALREQVPQLGFVPYQDKDQADVLAGRIGVHRAIAAVGFGTGRDEEPVTRQGFNAFLYHSRIPVAEGVQQNPLQYNGIYMPYAVWVPANLPPSPPLLVFLHGANQYQNVNLVHFNNPQSMLVPSPYDVPAVVIFPNGRTTSWGTPLADRDALDAISDALARPALDLNRDRVVLTGVSSGGIGTFQLGSRYPDVFTGGYSLVGADNPVVGTSPLENLTNVPFRASNGALDPLINVAMWRTSADALDAAATVDYRIVLVHNRSHDGPLAEGNCYYLDLLSRDRVSDPSRVRFTTMAFDQERADLGVLPTGAYWVSEMVARDNAAPAKFDAETLAKPERVVDQADIFEVKENLVTTADFCGSHPTMRNGTNWSTEGRSFKNTDRAERRNAMTGSVANLASATVDVTRADINSGDVLAFTLTGDGETALTLLGEWKGTVRVLLDGEEVARESPRSGRVVLPVIQGEHTYTLVPSGR